MADFEFDVGISVEEIRGDFEVIDESVRQLGSIVETVTSQFIRFEQEATSLGLTMREFTGITRDTEFIYKDFLRTFQGSNELAAEAITGFSGIAAELRNMAIEFLNARSAGQGFFDSVKKSLSTEARDFFEAIILQREELSDPGKAVRRKSDEQLERDETVNEARREQLVAEQRREEFPGLIARRTLLRLQAAEDPGVLPLEEVRRRQVQQLRMFDIRQQGTMELRQLMRETNNDEIIESNRLLRESIDNLARQLGISPQQAIGVLDTEDI